MRTPHLRERFAEYVRGYVAHFVAFFDLRGANCRSFAKFSDATKASKDLLSKPYVEASKVELKGSAVGGPTFIAETVIGAVPASTRELLPAQCSRGVLAVHSCEFYWSPLAREARSSLPAVGIVVEPLPFRPSVLLGIVLGLGAPRCCDLFL
jgi:hypothetical protein